MTWGDFELLRPWALALLVLAPIVLLAVRKGFGRTSDWEAIVDAPLLDFLSVENTKSVKSRGILWLMIGWVIACIALSGPSFRQAATETFDRQAPLMVVLDLSDSMRAEDLKPSRIERARYKLIDLLDRLDEMQVGLIAYAGEAFVVSPLTTDAGTIKAMVAALDPAIMPAPGSEPEEALVLAGELIHRVSESGDVLLIADSITSAATTVAADLQAAGVRVSVMGVGTAAGSPIPLNRGEGVLKSRSGDIVIAQLDESGMRDLAVAGGGRYVTMTAESGDLDALLATTSNARLENQFILGDEATQRRVDDGIWLVFLLIPLALLAFRRGILLVVPLCIMLPIAPSGHANDLEEAWSGAWQNREQRAQAALENEAYEQAVELSRDPLRAGSALYRAGDFEAAARAFSQDSSPDGHYNRGNSLAKMQKFEEAIAAYEEAIAAAPDHEDAIFNRDLLKEMAEQQQEQQNQEQSDENSDSEESEQSESESESSDEQESEEQQSEEGEPEPDEGEPGEAEEMEISEDDLDEEERQALEQWLRRIPDDPGGLLRRKFLLEYQRRGTPPSEQGEDW